MFNNNLLMSAASAGGESLVSVGNSALFDSNNSEFLARTPSSTGVEEKGTFSGWLYRGKQGFYYVFTARVSDSQLFQIYFATAGQLLCGHFSSGIDWQLTTTRVFRDVGWYHVVLGIDTTQAIASNRAKLYINGVQITDFDVETYPSLNFVNDFNTSSVANHLGSYNPTPANEYDGYMAEVVWIDGTQYDASNFGNFDSTGTFWTPLSNATIKELTFGTNGFYLDNTTNAQTDASGNGNNLTNNNTVTLSTHTPTNINCLLSPLWKNNSSVLSNGNRTVDEGATGWQIVMGTLGVSSGKWYWEVKAEAISSGEAMMTGIANDTVDAQQANSSGTGFYAYSSYGTTYSPSTSYGDTYGDDDIIGVQLNMDDGELHFYKNNTIQNSGTAAFTGLTGVYYPFNNVYNLYHPVYRFAEDEWSYTAPTGYKALTTTNIASAITRTKSNLEEYFDSTLYEGNGAGQRVGKFLPFTDTFTVGNSALFNGTDNSLDRTQVAGTSAGTVWTFSAWIKKCANKNTVYVNWGTGGTQGQLGFDASGNFVLYDGATTVGVASREFEDSSQWSHYHVAYDTGESGTDKVKLTINGVLITNWSTDNRSSANAFQNVGINGEVMRIGNNASAGSDAISLDGYMAQVVFLDGTASAASNFGSVDTSTGRWIPSDLSSFSFGSGNNTVFLDFADSDNLGDDESGQGHDFTNVNTVVQVADTPTVNIATLNSNDSAGGTLSNGNKTLVTTGSSDKSTQGTIRLPNTGKYYWESNLNVASSGSIGHIIALNNSTQALTTGNTAWTDTVLMNRTNSGSVKVNGSDLFTFSGTASTNDKFQVAVDLDDNKMWFGINNSFFNATGGTDGNPSTGANAMIVQDFAGYAPLFGNFNTQQTVRFDSADWTYTPPTGYVSLTQDSLPTGESYQTAFSWIKNRDATDNHMLFDRVRGIYNDMHSNASSNQVTNVNTLQRFLNGGVQVGNDVEVNTASESYVAWNWYMETTGSGTSNTDGTINTTATLVDTNIGLSISEFTGTGANATIGHGLGVVPQMYWVKGIDGGDHWYVYHADNTSAPETDALLLNGTTASYDDATLWNDTAPTSSVISLGSNSGVNQSSKKYLAMAFAPSQFTAIGSYIGNGNANGTFIPTINSLGVPIQPAWTIVKRTDAANSWGLGDGVRDPFNPVNQYLAADNNAAEASYSTVDKDYVLGGFKARGTSAGLNASGGTYIYMAIGTPIIDVDGRIITGR